ncbi:WG containing repeat-containing protein [Sphingobacterium wenxiniae]|uniref:WG containing repeat-containing protein n=2 Tax=Sphingobacterium wenxiniae TaxID=683125 RepID=A0A1I6VIB2_9SPHI|nr:WG containing repeat-containing protein [Sphingobacterium wenxiniae]
MLVIYISNAPIQAQEWQTFDKISFSDYTHPLVNVTKDGIKYYYHLDSQVWMDDMHNRAAGMTVGMKDGAYGVVRDDGKLIVPFVYDEVRVEDDYEGQWYEGIPYNYKFIVLQQDGLYGYADTNGHVLAQPKYQQLKVISKDIIAVAKDNRWGWLDALTGDLLQPCIYDEVSKTYLFDHYVIVTNSGKEGVATKDGTLVVPVEQEQLHFIKTKDYNYIHALKGGLATLYGISGEVMVEGDFPTLSAIAHSNMLSIRKNKHVGLLNPQTGKVVLEPQFSSIINYTRGLYIVVRDHNLYNVANGEGQLLFSTDFERLDFVNAEGRVKVSGQVVDISAYSERGVNLTPQQIANIKYEVKVDSLPYYIRGYKEGTEGLYDWTGKTVVPQGKYRTVKPYCYDQSVCFIVENTERKISVLDAQGKTLLPMDYWVKDTYQYNAQALSSNLTLKKRYLEIVGQKNEDSYTESIGLFDFEIGKLIVSPAPQSIKWLNENYFRIVKQGIEENLGRVSLYDKEGNALLQFDKEVRDVEMLGNHFLLVEKAEGYNSPVYVLMDIQGNILYENPQWKVRGSYGHINFPEPEGRSIAGFHAGLKKIYADETNLFINEKGEPKRFTDYEQVGEFIEDYGIVAKKMTTSSASNTYRTGNHLFGVIDASGKEVFPPIWSDVHAFGNSSLLLQVRLGDKVGLVDKRGVIILEPEYEYIEWSSGKPYLQIRKDGKEGLITAEGKVVIEPRYDNIRTSYEGEEKTWPILVKDGDWYYFVRKNGKPYTIRSKSN